MNSQGLAQLAYEKGMYILAAAEGNQLAQELDKYQHGLLTYALVVEGLEKFQADDAPHDGQISLREWFDYASERVPQLQQEGSEVATSKRAAIQQPRAFYRRDPKFILSSLPKPDPMPQPLGPSDAFGSRNRRHRRHVLGAAEQHIMAYWRTCDYLEMSIPF